MMTKFLVRITRVGHTVPRGLSLILLPYLLTTCKLCVRADPSNGGLEESVAGSPSVSDYWTNERMSNCYYYCTTEVHDLPGAAAYSHCQCSPEDQRNNSPTSAFFPPLSSMSSAPASCTSPSSDSCFWYRECLEKLHPCEASHSAYAITFGEKMCLKFDMSYSSFTSKGQKWIDAVRRCLQTTMGSFLDTMTSQSCNDIKTRAFASHSVCYLHPSASAPSVCDLSLADLWNVFWTIKGAFVHASYDTLQGFLDVTKGCVISNILTT